MSLRAPAVVALGVLALGCGRGGPGGAVEPLRVALEEIEALAPAARFTSMREVVLAGDAFWVLDGAPPFLSRIALGGGQVMASGGRGRGPGEFLDPRSIAPTSDSSGLSVLVWDYATGRVNRFDAAGAFRGTDPLDEAGVVRARGDLDRVSFVDPYRVRGDGEGVLVARFPARLDRSADLALGVLGRADHRLTPGPPLATFADHLHSAARPLREWEPLPLWDACAGTVALWSPDSSRVLWMDGRGQPLRVASVAMEPEPLTTADIERYLQWMARLELGPGFEGAGIDFGALALASREQFAERRPLATDLRCESPDIAWLRLFETDVDPLGRGRTWLRVGAAGASLTVTFPTEFTPFLFVPGAVYGALEVPEGHQRLARWSHAPIAQKPQGLSTPLPDRRDPHAH